MLKKIDAAMFSAYIFIQSMIHDFCKKENGDTNFISIIIILGIVMIVAALFMKFRTKITDQVSNAVESFKIE